MEPDYIRDWLNCNHYLCRHAVTMEGVRSFRITCADHWDGAGNTGAQGDAIIVRDYMRS